MSWLNKNEYFGLDVQKAPLELIDKVETYKQNRYDSSVAKLQNDYTNLLGLDISLDKNKEQLSQDMNQAREKINSLSSKDLGLQENYNAANDAFNPILSNRSYMEDYAKTQQYRKQFSDAEDAKTKEGGKYYDSNSDFLLHKKYSDFTKSDNTPSAISNHQVYQYTPFYDGSVEIRDLEKQFNDKPNEFTYEVQEVDSKGNALPYRKVVVNKGTDPQAMRNFVQANISDKAKQHFMTAGAADSYRYVDNDQFLNVYKDHIDNTQNNLLEQQQHNNEQLCAFTDDNDPRRVEALKRQENLNQRLGDAAEQKLYLSTPEGQKNILANKENAWGKLTLDKAIEGSGTAAYMQSSTTTKVDEPMLKIMEFNNQASLARQREGFELALERNKQTHEDARNQLDNNTKLAIAAQEKGFKLSYDIHGNAYLAPTKPGEIPGDEKTYAEAIKDSPKDKILYSSKEDFQKSINEDYKQASDNLASFVANNKDYVKDIISKISPQMANLVKNYDMSNPTIKAFLVGQYKAYATNPDLVQNKQLVQIFKQIGTTDALYRAKQGYENEKLTALSSQLDQHLNTTGEKLPSGVTSKDIVEYQYTGTNKNVEKVLAKEKASGQESSYTLDYYLNNSNSIKAITQEINKAFSIDAFPTGFVVVKTIDPKNKESLDYKTERVNELNIQNNTHYLPEDFGNQITRNTHDGSVTLVLQKEFNDNGKTKKVEESLTIAKQNTKEGNQFDQISKERTDWAQIVGFGRGSSPVIPFNSRGYDIPYVLKSSNTDPQSLADVDNKGGATFSVYINGTRLNLPEKFTTSAYDAHKAIEAYVEDVTAQIDGNLARKSDEMRRADKDLDKAFNMSEEQRNSLENKNYKDKYDEFRNNMQLVRNEAKKNIPNVIIKNLNNSGNGGNTTFDQMKLY
jgi:hypothetical protein